MNIARSDADSKSNPSLGVFDLTDPASAFCLAQFILGLNTHFHAIIAAALQPQIRTLEWRSDYIAMDDLPDNGEQWRNRVEHWARDLISDDSR